MADAPARLWSNRREGDQRAASDSQPEMDSLDRIVQQGRLGSDPLSRERGRNLVREFVEQVLDGSMRVSRDAMAMINSRIAQIDHLVSIQLNEILHQPEFQRLEAAWRGLWYLVDRTSWRGCAKVRVWNVTKRELLEDLREARERRESALYRAVVFEGSETLGSEPFSILLGNYAFGRGPEDIELLEKASVIGLAAHAPFLAAASPQMFQCETFAEGLPSSPFGPYFQGFRVCEVEFVPAVAISVCLCQVHGSNPSGGSSP